MKTRLSLAVALALALAGCESLLGDWMGESEGPPLPGERISVMRLEQELEPDPRIADLAVRLPPPWRNADWPQAGGLPSHAMHHLEVEGGLATVWRASAGDGGGGGDRVMAPPVVADGRLFALDARGQISAFEFANGQRLWSYNLTPPKEERGALGGGLAVDDGVLYVTTGYGFIHALDPATGEQIWEKRIGVPFRAAPAAANGRVFAISYDNQLHALAAADGRVLWTHAGIPEDAGVIGGAAPAVAGGVVVAPYSSGEVVALRVENGRVVWGDQLVRQARFTPLASLSDIRGRPVIDRGRVLAISYSGRLAAIDLRTGERIWEREVAGAEEPWVAGDFIFLVTTQAEVVCLSRADGRIRWVTQLQQFEDEKRKEDPVLWSGPVLASDRLVLASNHGQAVSVSPYTGEVLGKMELPDGVTIAPIIADGAMVLYTDDAELVALR
jgi:outer membrane protein assembly factor BamB